jgi:Cu/Ag efflux pump CusA
MNLIRTALRKPITILVLVAGMVFFGINAVRNIKVDIFPDMNLPVIYISHPFGGYTPTQMEAFLASSMSTYYCMFRGKKYRNQKHSGTYPNEADLLSRYKYGASCRRSIGV